MHVKVEKYDGVSFKLVVPKLEADALGLKHGMILEIPTIKIVKEPKE